MNRRLFTQLLVVVLVAVGVTAGLTYWSVQVLLAPPNDIPQPKPFATVEAVAGVVESSTALNVSAEWAQTGSVTNGAVGVVTEIDVGNGSEVAPGDVLYTVDLAPVMAIEGSIPSFRDLSQGTQGKDVMQLQQFLNNLNYYPGKIDGKFEIGTENAVKKWQASVDMAASGTVSAGSFIAFPSLPVKINVNSDSLTLGQQLAGGEKAMTTLGAYPSFRLPLGDGQLGIIKPNMQVTIQASPDDTWLSSTSELTVEDSGASSYSLEGPDGQPICSTLCNEVPTEKPTLYPSSVQVVPAVTGTVVPSAAIQTSSSGESLVISSNGKRIPVSVQASAKGQTVVTGVKVGEVVRLPKGTNE